MCKICRQMPCSRRCPNYEPKKVLWCANGCPIYEGEDYYELPDGSVYCEHCINGFIKTAEEEDDE